MIPDINQLLMAAEDRSAGGIPKRGLVMHASLNGETPTKAETGQTIAVHGTASYSTVDGIPCLVHTNGTESWLTVDAALSTSRGWTLSCWARHSKSALKASTWVFGINQKTAWGKGLHLYFAANNNNISVVHGGGSSDMGGGYLTPNVEWRHYAVVMDLDAPLTTMYINGEVAWTRTTQTTTYLTSYSQIRFCTDYSGTSRGKLGTYNLAACRVYNRPLKAEEVAELYKEFAQEPEP